MKCGFWWTLANDEKRWGFTPDRTRGCPPLDPDSLARGQYWFVHFVVKPKWGMGVLATDEFGVS